MYYIKDNARQKIDEELTAFNARQCAAHANRKRDKRRHERLAWWSGYGVERKNRRPLVLSNAEVGPREQGHERACGLPSLTD